MDAVDRAFINASWLLGGMIGSIMARIWQCGMSSGNVSDSSGSQLTVYVRPVNASWGLSVWCERDILAGYHLGSAGSIRAETGVPGGGGGGVSAGAPEPELWPDSRSWRHMWRHLGGVGLVAVVVYQLVASGRFGFGLRHCQSHGGVLGHVVCVWVFVVSSMEECCVLSAIEGAQEEGVGRVLLLCGARELMSFSWCVACVQSSWWVCGWRATAQRRCSLEVCPSSDKCWSSAYSSSSLRFAISRSPSPLSPVPGVATEDSPPASGSGRTSGCSGDGPAAAAAGFGAAGGAEGAGCSGAKGVPFAERMSLTTSLELEVGPSEVTGM